MGAERLLTEQQKEIAKLFSSLCIRHSPWQVWADFIEASAISIQNVFGQIVPTKKGAEMERRYLEIQNCYVKQEREVFPRMFALTVDAIDADPEQDFLGEMFMILELGSNWKGQFFTPYSICRLMAETQAPNVKTVVDDRGWAGIYDPTCGAGALLIAARNVFSRNGIGSDRLLFAAQDVDRIAGLMCYVQLSLLGCAGYVAIADTINNPILGADSLFPIFTESHDVWFTPMWFSDVWSERRVWYAAGTQEGRRKK